MFDNITIGQYVNGGSFVHKLDPRLKMVALLFLIVAIFLIPIPNSLTGISLASIYTITGFLIFISLVFISTKISLFKVLSSLKGLMFLLTFMAIIQIITNQVGDELGNFDFFFSFVTILIIIGVVSFYLFSKKFVPFTPLYFLIIVTTIIYVLISIDIYTFNTINVSVTTNGLIRAIFIFIRVVVIIITASLLTFTTSPNDISNATESLMAPLKLIKVPVSVFAMMFSLTLRFIPSLIGQMNKIIAAQTSRGVDFKESTIIKKVKQIVSLLVPVLVLAINSAIDLADTMEVRGYIVGAKRTKIDKNTLKLNDYFVGLLILGIFSGCLVLRILS